MWTMDTDSDVCTLSSGSELGTSPHPHLQAGDRQYEEALFKVKAPGHNSFINEFNLVVTESSM